MVFELLHYTLFNLKLKITLGSQLKAQTNNFNIKQNKVGRIQIASTLENWCIKVEVYIAIYLYNDHNNNKNRVSGLTITYNKIYYELQVCNNIHNSHCLAQSGL